MAIQTRPDGKIFAGSAKAGEVVDFPDIDRGWGVAFEQTGGVPPMEWFNSVGMRADKAAAYYLQRGVPEWAAAEDYPAGACVQYAGRTYQAKVAHQGKQPDISTTEWERWALSPGDITTPAQFDNSTKIATTEFVKQSGVKYSDITVIKTSRALQASDVGQLLVGGGTFTLTFPSPFAGMLNGDGFTIVNHGASDVITLTFSGCTYLYGSNSKSADIRILPGESLSFCKYYDTQWAVTGGTAAMGGIGSFGASLSASGYQKLPSGLIVQWGYTTTGTTGVQVTFPIAFPTSSAPIITLGGNNTGPIMHTQQGASKTGFFAQAWSLSGTSSSGSSFGYIAIGY